MITVKLTNYERNDLVRVLEYAVNNYRYDFKKGKMNEYEYTDHLERVSTLKKRIDGISPREEFGLQKSFDKSVWGVKGV